MSKRRTHRVGRLRFGRAIGLAAAVTVVVPSLAPAQIFGNPAALYPSSPTNSIVASLPSLVTDGTGTWLIAWRSGDTLGGTIGTDADILFARSTDGGVTWTGPAALNSNAALDVGDDSEPVLAYGAGTWLAVWHSDDTLGGTLGTDPDLLVSRSTDGGMTWTPPVPLNSDAATDGASDYDWLPTVTGDSAGTWVAAWRSGAPDAVSVSRSLDGITWSAPVTFVGTGGGLAPSVATDGAGTWIVTWHASGALGGSIGFDEDILFTRSTDGGSTWTPEAPLATNAATDSGDDQEPYVTTDGAGTWVAVWYSEDTLGGTIGGDRDVLVARSTDGGATWTDPAALNTNAATDDGSRDQGARVTADGTGAFVATWYSEDTLGGTLGTDYDVLLARSTDGGATWTNPAALSATALTDAAGDFGARTATDGEGTWVAAWLTDAFGGTVVLVATGARDRAVGVAARKLVVLDKLAAGGPAKTVFVSKDRSAPIQKGTGTFLDGIGLELHLAYADGSAAGEFVIPAGASDGTSGWDLNDVRVARYTNGLAPGGDTQARLAVLKPARVFKLVGRGLGDATFDVLAAGPPTPQAIGKVVTAYCVDNEAARICHCSAFPECSYKPIGVGTGAKLVCKGGLPDATCAALGSP